MKNLLIEQRNPQGVLKVWRLRAQAQKPGQRNLFGTSKHAELRSVDPSVRGIQGSFEWNHDHWVYLNLDLNQENQDEPAQIKIGDGKEFKIGTTILKVTGYADRHNLLSALENLPVIEDKDLKLATHQIYVVTCDANILETQILPKKKPFVSKFDPASTQIQAHLTARWMTSAMGHLEIHQRSVHGNSRELHVLGKEAFMPKDGRGPIVATLLGACVLAALFVLSPESKDAGQVARNQAPPIAYREIKMAPAKKLKAASVNKVAATEPVQTTAAAAPSGASHLQTIKALGSTSRLSALIGKISAGAAKSANIVITQGVVAGTAPSARALASVGKEKSGKDWGAEGRGEQFKISTLGTAGGKGVSGMGSLNSGKTGAGGAELLEEESEIIGGLDREVIAQYIRTQIGQILYCYERQLSASPDLYGKVAVRFTIGSKGEVETQRIGDSTLRNAAVEGCILQRVAKWKFPAPEGGTKVNVTYPFLFKSTN